MTSAWAVGRSCPYWKHGRPHLRIGNRRGAGEDLLAAKQRESGPDVCRSRGKGDCACINRLGKMAAGRPTRGGPASSNMLCRKLARKRVPEITAADVLDIVGGIWTNRHETAKKVKRRLGAVLAWAVTRGYRSDNPVQAIQVALPKADNPQRSFQGHSP